MAGGANICGFSFVDTTFNTMQYGVVINGAPGAPTVFSRSGYGNISQAFVQAALHTISFHQCACQNDAGGKCVWVKGDGDIAVRDCQIVNNIANATDHIVFDTTQNLLIESCFIDGSGEVPASQAAQTTTAVRAGLPPNALLCAATQDEGVDARAAQEVRKGIEKVTALDRRRPFSIGFFEAAHCANVRPA